MLSSASAAGVERKKGKIKAKQFMNDRGQMKIEN